MQLFDNNANLLNVYFFDGIIISVTYQIIEVLCIVCIHFENIYSMIICICSYYHLNSRYFFLY